MSDRSLTPELLLGAYAAGIFPMAESQDAPDVYWVEPQQRGIIPLDGFHISRSLARHMRKSDIKGTLNLAFEEVLDGCADRDETWINETIRDLMVALHDRGFAHSFEVWEDGDLAGGMYGVALGGAFFGESMFSRSTNGSKMVLAYAVDHLRRTGFTLFDTQFLTDHLASLGAIEIGRSDYKERLAAALDADADLYRVGVERDAQAVVQRITQTS